MPGIQPKNTWVLIVSGVVALVLVVGVVLLDEIAAPVDGVIRIGALLGYLMVFLAAVSSNYMRELTRYFGRRFVQVHHVASVTALVALALHATSAAWRAGSLNQFVPQFGSLRQFLSLGGRPAFWLIAITSLTALLRASIGDSWKTVHWLNYLAFLLGTVHAQLIGPNFQHLGVRIVSIVMAVAVVAVFALKRLEVYRRNQRRRARS
ncbi:MAG: ferric reductase-like transmembrane domain-containing protein [Anaerolineae bacterium]|nr:ferric reductase-like transmembrane domain-containing protein [Anaerolineae bacterium]